MDATDELEKFIHDELKAFAEEYVRVRIAFLENRKIKASGELADSLATEITQQARGEAIQMLLAFEEYGRFIDMKRLNAPQVGHNTSGAKKSAGGQNAYVFALEEWIKKRGWEQKFTDAFMSKRKLRKVPTNVLRQIAWGIAVKRSDGKFRRRAWYAKSKTASIADLFNKIAAGIPDIALKTIRDSF